MMSAALQLFFAGVAIAYWCYCHFEKHVVTII